MKRLYALIALVAVLTVLGFVLAGHPGQVSADWLGWRIDTSAALVLVLGLAATLLFTALWSLGLWLARAPRRAAQARAATRARQNLDALSSGCLALAAGDVAEARRHSRRAVELDQGALGLLLSAQAAEAEGDDAAAQGAYAALLDMPDAKAAARRGLMQLALRRGDCPAALAYAEGAYEVSHVPWAWRTLLEARLEAADWTAALALVRDGLERKILPAPAAERMRAALLATQAAGLEAQGDPASAREAQELALEAAKLNPGFAPGVALAARLLAASDKEGRAATLLENAWKTAPHPVLGLAYRDLKASETPRDRARRLLALAALNPGHRESRILAVEQALMVGDPAGARAALALLGPEAPTARVCALQARAAFAAGEPEAARVWIARAGGAPQEPDWSDLDLPGRAFACTPADWARLALSYGDTGELIHPRLERHERAPGRLADLTLAIGPPPFPERPGPPPAVAPDGAVPLQPSR